MKAGYLIKENGVWTLTTEGEQAISLGAELLETATKKYRIWSNDEVNKKDDTLIDDSTSPEDK
jgi:restriction system protein